MKRKYSEDIAESIQKMSIRLNKLREELSLSKSEFAKQLGYANQSPLTRIGNSSSFIGPDKLQKLAEIKGPMGAYPNINWLLTGIGPMFMSIDTPGSSYDKSTALNNRHDHRKTQAAEIIAELIDTETLTLLVRKLENIHLD